ncbi:PH domain-containing protein [Rhodococcus sp. HNM0569]|uniref:PH domain-containing protein n=1 Tax=Rhodococcus sp. HNM0569 TaxID=2716340 RepID=UPI00146D2CEC|nr:PH domain-containing protein [Rhodococcus sp. HNM0569]
MPPPPSSHTAAPRRQVLRSSRLAYLGCAFLLFAVSFPVFGNPIAFGWLALAPIVAVVWVARVRTEVDTDGITTRTLFGSHPVAWDDIAGVRFRNRSWARATRTDGTEVTLPFVTFERVPELAEASGGRISDPYAAARAAADATDRGAHAGADASEGLEGDAEDQVAQSPTDRADGDRA